MRLLACALVLVPALAAAQSEGSLRLTLLGGLDTNPARDFGPATRSDATTSAEAVAHGAVQRGRWSLSADGALGGRVYASQGDQNVFVQQASLEGEGVVLDGVALALRGRAKDVLGGDRPYADLSGGPAAVFSFSPRFAFDLEAQGRRFLYRPLLAYSFGALELSAQASYRFSAHHFGSVAFGSSSRTFDAAPVPAPGTTSPDARRQDSVLAAEVGYRFRGPFTLAITAGYQESSSNSFGESAQHYRLTAQAGVRLPFSVMLFVAGSLQLSHYPDGVLLSPELLLVEDSEALDSAAARLVRPLGEHLDAELRYGLYSTRLPTNGLSYLRQVMTLGVTARY